jgi:hypothetical protein
MHAARKQRAENYSSRQQTPHVSPLSSRDLPAEVYTPIAIRQAKLQSVLLA